MIRFRFRADHVIIQSYEEQMDHRRLYVAFFIKDPYRQAIALTNHQILSALEKYRQELYGEIKHHVKKIYSIDMNGTMNGRKFIAFRSIFQRIFLREIS